MIKLIKPYITFEEVEENFVEIFESGWFTKGKYVAEFREELKSYLGSNYSHLTTSATTALTISLKAYGVGKGDEIIVSDFSFPATSNVVEDLGAVPIFADVSLDTFNMLPEELESKISSKTKAVIFVDALGNPSGISEIKDICDKYNLPLIEDGACAIGSSENGKNCGNIADITCFSFHPRKLLTTGEGGALTFNDESLESFFNVKLNHGSINTDGKFDFVDYGYNYRLPELQCVMGIKQLKKLDDIVKSRNSIRDQFVRRLEPHGFKAQKISKESTSNIQSLVFKVPDNIDRNELIEKLRVKGVESTIGTYSLSACSYNMGKYNNIQKNSYKLQERTLTLPCYEEVDIDLVCKSIIS